MLTKILLTLTALVALLLLMIPEHKTQAARFPIPSPLLVDPAQQLQAQVTRSIELSQPKISPARKKVFVVLATHIAETTFSNPEHRRMWIALIGVESGYNSAARSSTGAVGLGQLIPRYKDDFGRTCGLTPVAAADLSDDATNLALSSCYLKELIEANHGDIALAMVAYTAGPYSNDMNNAKRGKAVSASTSDYVRHVTRLSANAR